MSLKMDEDIKRWTAKRKSALVVDIIQGKTTVAQASRAYDLSPSEIEKWVDDAKREMENALIDLQAVPVVRYCPTHGVLQTHEGRTKGQA